MSTNPSVPGASPATKTARQARITAILTGESVRSQAELAALLADDGVQVTQATLSRDLVELGAVRVRGGKEGALVYAVPGGRVGTAMPRAASPRKSWMRG